MSYLLIAISLFWFLRMLKSVLFWVYLWQLKGYHIGRFIDHFRTHKGKKIFLNYLVLLKLLLFFGLFIYFQAAALLLVFTYILEFLLFISGRFRKPIFTFKAIFLTLCSLIVTIGFWFAASKFNEQQFTTYLLGFDVLSPIIFTLVVLLIQPFFVVIRNNVLSKARQKMAKFPSVKVIAITGSYGKTSTKEFLTTILSSKFKVLSTKEHKNSEMGIAETILKELKPEHEIFIVEMGAYSKGGINLLCSMVKPGIGMVTGVNEQHLSTFRSMDNLLSAEGGRELLSNLPKDGLLIVNGDNKYCLDLYKSAHIDKRVYSLKGDKVDSDIFASEITVGENSLDFLAMTREKITFHFNIGVLGKQNVQNLLGAILIAKELGMTLEEISKASKNIRQEQAGITLKKGIHGINVIDSSYSSNPNGVMADIDYLNVFKGKKMVVMPCLIELGRKSAEVHQQIGKKIAEVCDMAIITTKDKFKEIVRGSQLANTEEKHSDIPRNIGIVFAEKPREILNHITTFCKEGDTVLLEGRVPSELIRFLTK